MSAIIHVGDALDVLRRLPDGLARTCVTSPPYWGLRDYGTEGQIGLEADPAEYLARMVEIFREVRRVLAPDGTAWVNMGDSYIARSCAPGGLDGSTLEGSTEGQERAKGARASRRRDRAVVMPARGAPKGTYRNGSGTGQGMTSWSHRAQARLRASVEGLKPKDLVGMPWRLAFALQADGWYLRSDVIWSKPNPMPESVTDRPTRSHEYLFLLARAKTYYYDSAAIAEPLQPSTRVRLAQDIDGQAGSSRANGGTRPDRPMKTVHRPPSGWDTGPGDHRARTGRYASGNKERRPGTETGRSLSHVGRGFPWDADEAGGLRNRRSVWTISTRPFKGAHFATFPPALVRPCILAGSAPGDVVLDPFAGAGTTGLVASRLGRSFVGVEINPEYAAMALERIRADAPLFHQQGES